MSPLASLRKSNHRPSACSSEVAGRIFGILKAAFVAVGRISRSKTRQGDGKNAEIEWSEGALQLAKPSAFSRMRSLGMKFDVRIPLKLCTAFELRI